MGHGSAQMNTDQQRKDYAMASERGLIFSMTERNALVYAAFFSDLSGLAFNGKRSGFSMISTLRSTSKSGQ